MKKISVVLTLLAAAAMLLSACGPAATTAAPATMAPAPATQAPAPATAAPAVPVLLPTNTPVPHIKVGEVTDFGGIDDKSFNALGWKGVTDADLPVARGRQVPGIQRAV